MAEILIRPAVATDLPTLMKLDHSCTSEYVWQMDTVQEDGQAGAVFREIRLPRLITISYPRPVTKLADDWNRRTGMLVGLENKEIAGYLRLTDKIVPQVAWILDLLVVSNLRRNGIGSALVLGAQAWAKDRGDQKVILECTSKNAAAIRLAQKLGYEFCGYNDHYYQTQEIALFFCRAL